MNLLRGLQRRYEENRFWFIEDRSWKRKYIVKLDDLVKCLNWKILSKEWFSG